MERRAARHAAFRPDPGIRELSRAGGPEGDRPRRLQVAEVRSVERTNYPLTLVAVLERELRLEVSYEPGRFERAAVCRLLGHLAVLLDGMASDPERPLAELPMLTGPELRQVLHEWNPPRAESAPGRCLHELFADVAATAPDAVAVTCEDRHLSYRELGQRAGRVAGYLRALRVGAGDRVAIYVDRGPELVVAVLGVLEAGGAYVPLDTSSPAARLGFVLEDAQVAALLTQEALRARLPQTASAVLCLEAMERSAGAQPGLTTRATPGDPAYVIYTSGLDRPAQGRAGEPRECRPPVHGDLGLVPVRRRRRLDRCSTPRPSTSRSGRSGAPCSTAAAWWWCRARSSSRRKLSTSCCAGSRVTVLNQTPSAFRQLIRADEAAAADGLALRWVVFGGEALEIRGLVPWWQRHGDERPRLINMYGITETTVHVTYRPLGAADAAGEPGQLPIGRPIADLEAYVLDAHAAAGARRRAGRDLRRWRRRRQRLPRPPRP